MRSRKFPGKTPAKSPRIALGFAVVVLTASHKFVDVVPKFIQTGELPPDTPPDLGAVVDRANSATQNEVAALVPGPVHVTDTHPGHNIMIDNAAVVIQAPSQE